MRSPEAFTICSGYGDVNAMAAVLDRAAKLSAARTAGRGAHGRFVDPTVKTAAATNKGALAHMSGVSDRTPIHLNPAQNITTYASAAMTDDGSGRVRSSVYGGAAALPHRTSRRSKNSNAANAQKEAASEAEIILRNNARGRYSWPSNRVRSANAGR